MITYESNQADVWRRWMFNLRKLQLRCERERILAIKIHSRVSKSASVIWLVSSRALNELDPVTTPVVETSFRSQASRGIFISTGYANNAKLLTLTDTLTGDLSRVIFVQRHPTVWMQYLFAWFTAKIGRLSVGIDSWCQGEQVRRGTPTDKLRL